MIDFNWERDVTPGVSICYSTLSQSLNFILAQSIKINWKDDSKNLTKISPRTKDEADDLDDLPADTGSFFNFFEYADDPFDVCLVLLCIETIRLIYIAGAGW